MRSMCGADAGCLEINYQSLAGASYRGSLLMRNCHPPQDHHSAICILLLQGPGGSLFLMSEVPLYPAPDPHEHSAPCELSVQGYLAHKKHPPS